jgi:hypothetical protein
MRAATHYYLTQAWPPHQHRQVKPSTPSRAASRARLAYAARRDHPRPPLPAFARRVLDVLGGASPAA